MANGKELMLPEIRKHPKYRFLALGDQSPALLTQQQTSIIGFVCSTKQKGLGTNLIGSWHDCKLQNTLVNFLCCK